MYKTLIEAWTSLNKKEKDFLVAGISVILIVGLFSIVFLPWALTRECWSITNYNSTGGIGETINGISGPFIALLASILTFFAFYVQYKANVQQRQQFLRSLELQKEETNEQKRIWDIQRFENKYFELIKMHRDNVAELEIGDDTGRKIFVILIREFRSIHEITKDIAKKTKQVFSQEQIMIISYYALFFGVGPNSSRTLKEALSNYDSNFVDKFERKLVSKETQEDIQKDKNFDFRPFGGHQSRLGHYYRHLYQTVSYVNKQPFSFEEKYEYIKTIRAQLTTHEQALLFINCLTPIGKIWWDKKLIDDYRFVQNIPFGFFDKESEINLPAYFSDNYFEWQERTVEKDNKISQPT